MDERKAIARLIRAATTYTNALGTSACTRALERLKRAARDYANTIHGLEAQRLKRNVGDYMQRFTDGDGGGNGE